MYVPTQGYHYISSHKGFIQGRTRLVPEGLPRRVRSLFRRRALTGDGRGKVPPPQTASLDPSLL
jgi:hypothetical protein